MPSISADVMRNEPIFLALDGGMLLIAIGLVSSAHPYMFFPYLGVRSKVIKQYEQQQDEVPLTTPHHEQQAYQQQPQSQPYYGYTA